MNKITLALIASNLIMSQATVAGAPNTNLNLMPYPHYVKTEQGKVWINKNFNIYIKGYNSERVKFNARRTMKRLYRQTGLPMLNWQAASEKEATLVIDIQNKPESEVQNMDINESYELIAEENQILIRSEQPYGAFHGLETFLQLVTTNSKGYYIPHISVKDSPRFKWRGVSYDTSRHFIEPEVILRQLDAMASAKMNVFHWHIWDDQAIRIQLDNYKKLWELTADGEYYSKDEIRYIVDYANKLGIRVVPEISLPGHASAVAHAYPELMSATGKQSYPRQRGWGVFEPLMDPTNPELYKMLNSVFDEVVELFPDEYVHIGGDEPNYKQWKENPRIQKFISDNGLDGERGLQSYLNAKVEKMLEDRGKKMTGWDEIWHKDLPTSIVIQSWRGHDSIGRAAKQGYKGILSTGYYLDQPQPTSYHYRNDPMPEGLSVDDKLHDGEKFTTYNWVKPRTKGGPRIGNLTIIEAKDGRFRAFTDYNGKSRQEVYVDDYIPGKKFTGHFDNFMSYTEFNYRFDGKDIKPSSYQLIGNVRWPVTGHLVAGSTISGSHIPVPTGGYPAELTADEQKLILGGEITIWGENLNSMTIEHRLWPRSYAIAERFWSAMALQDEKSMYKRMAAIDRWSEISLGLRHHADADIMLKRLANGKDPAPLQLLAKYAEPAQYYARNWEKWASTPEKGELYNQHERLNRFVDTLPVESMAVYEMQELVTDYTGGNKSALGKLAMHYSVARKAALLSIPIFEDNVASVATLRMAESTVEVADLALSLIDKAQKGVQISKSDAERILQIINKNAVIIDESIVAITRPTEQLLKAIVK